MGRFGFAKYYDIHDSELCIKGFYKLGYEVGFARVCVPQCLGRRIITDVDQESFNSRLKAEGDETSTNLYVSNLPRNMKEAVSSSSNPQCFTTKDGNRNLVLFSWTILLVPAEFFGTHRAIVVELVLLGKNLHSSL